MNNLLVLRIMLDVKLGYVLDQDVMIDTLLKDHGLKSANKSEPQSTRIAIMWNIEGRIRWLQRLKLDMQAINRLSPSLGVSFKLHVAPGQTSVFLCTVQSDGRTSRR